MVRGIANSKIGFGDLILLLRYFFKLKVSTHPNKKNKNLGIIEIENPHLIILIMRVSIQRPMSHPCKTS